MADPTHPLPSSSLPRPRSSTPRSTRKHTSHLHDDNTVPSPSGSKRKSKRSKNAHDIGHSQDHLHSDTDNLPSAAQYNQPESAALGMQGANWFQTASMEEVFEDLSSRFILNLPEEELSSPERVCFQVEQAHWFYEDFIRTERPSLPSLPLKSFSSLFFHHTPLLTHFLHDEGGYERLWERFMKYKMRVPVCGGVMLNGGLDKCVLVKGWKASSSWGFPKGKINDEEEKWKCAIREVWEETGYDMTPLLNPDDFIEVTMNDQKMTLFIVPGVPEETVFKTLTRKEISAIEWFKLTDLPTWKKSKTKTTNKKFYMLAPCVAPLKQWIKLHRDHPPDPQALFTSDHDADADIENSGIDSDALTPMPASAQPIAIETQLRVDGGRETRKIELEVGEHAVATHVSAATDVNLSGEAGREVRRNEKGESLDELFARFLGVSRAQEPTTPAKGGMEALLAKLATPPPAHNQPNTFPISSSVAQLGSPLRQSEIPSFPTSASVQFPVSPSRTEGSHANNLLSMLSPRSIAAIPSQAPPPPVPPHPSFPVSNSVPNLPGYPQAHVAFPSSPSGPITPAANKDEKRKLLLQSMMSDIGKSSPPPLTMLGDRPPPPMRPPSSFSIDARPSTQPAIFNGPLDSVDLAHHAHNMPPNLFPRNGIPPSMSGQLPPQNQFQMMAMQRALAQQFPASMSMPQMGPHQPYPAANAPPPASQPLPPPGSHLQPSTGQNAGALLNVLLAGRQ